MILLYVIELWLNFYSTIIEMYNVCILYLIKNSQKIKKKLYYDQQQTYRGSDCISKNRQTHQGYTNTLDFLVSVNFKLK